MSIMAGVSAPLLLSLYVSTFARSGAIYKKGAEIASDPRALPFVHLAGWPKN
jgi:hypothetical protein